MDFKTECTECGVHLAVTYLFFDGVLECPSCGHSMILPPMELPKGSVIDGFTIASWLGSGSVADVYLAHQESMDRMVALKILKPKIARDDAAVESFVNGVRIAAQITHPNITKAFESGSDSGCNYIAMNYVEGKTLEALCLDGTAWKEDEALTLVEKTADALAYAWREHKLIHRGVMPGNIIIDAAGEPVLTDMGLAMQVDNVVAEEDAYGMVHYMSPEQVKGDVELDRRTDIYSLGATLYYLLSGAVPFSGGSSSEVMHNILHSRLRDPRLDGHVISLGCMDLLESMLARHTEDRYRSWGVLRKDIELVAKGQHPRKKRPHSEASVLHRKVIVGGGGRRSARSSASAPDAAKASAPAAAGRAGSSRPAAKSIAEPSPENDENTPRSRPRSSYRVDQSNRGMWGVIIAMVLVVVIGGVVLSAGSCGAGKGVPVETAAMKQQKSDSQAREEIYYYMSSLVGSDPDAIDEAEEKLGELTEMTLSADVKEEVAQALAKMPVLREEGEAGAWRRLSKKVHSAVGREGKGKGIEMLNSYDGIYAEELKEKRQELIAELGE